MPIYKIQNNSITLLPKTTFSAEKINEARDLQKFLVNSLEIIENDLFLLSSEFGYWAESKRRIDILCLDKSANLVVIELKRTDDGGHMELQAIRYAAMVSNMTFEDAIKVKTSYCDKIGESSENVKEDILQFLEWESEESGLFAVDVRIILISADFNKEVTSSVLWLLNRDIDIKCIKMVPQKDVDELYLDIQQIIPLPEATDFQVKLREKQSEQRQVARISSRDYTKFNLSICGNFYEKLNKRELVYQVVSNGLQSKIPISKLIAILSKKRWLVVDKICYTTQEFEEEIGLMEKKYDSKRWFNKAGELFHIEGKTYSLKNQYGGSALPLVKEILETFPELNGEVEAHP